MWIGNTQAHSEDELEWCGLVPGASDLLNEVDLVFLPTDHEGLPMVVLEALGAGVPFVGSAVGAIPELVSQGGGLGVANDAHIMAGTIVELLGNDQRYKDLSSQGLKVWEASYSHTAMAEGYENIYRELLCV